MGTVYWPVRRPAEQCFMGRVYWPVRRPDLWVRFTGLLGPPEKLPGTVFRRTRNTVPHGGELWPKATGALLPGHTDPQRDPEAPEHSRTRAPVAPPRDPAPETQGPRTGGEEEGRCRTLQKAPSEALGPGLPPGLGGEAAWVVAEDYVSPLIPRPAGKSQGHTDGAEEEAGEKGDDDGEEEEEDKTQRAPSAAPRSARRAQGGRRWPP